MAGYEIVDGDGETICWTVSPLLATLIAELLERDEAARKRTEDHLNL